MEREIWKAREQIRELEGSLQAERSRYETLQQNHAQSQDAGRNRISDLKARVFESARTIEQRDQELRDLNADLENKVRAFVSAL